MCRDNNNFKYSFKKKNNFKLKILNLKNKNYDLQVKCNILICLTLIQLHSCGFHENVMKQILELHHWLAQYLPYLIFTLVFSLIFHIIDKSCVFCSRQFSGSNNTRLQNITLWSEVVFGMCWNGNIVDFSECLSDGGVSYREGSSAKWPLVPVSISFGSRRVIQWLLCWACWWGEVNPPLVRGRYYHYWSKELAKCLYYASNVSSVWRDFGFEGKF